MKSLIYSNCCWYYTGVNRVFPTVIYRCGMGSQDSLTTGELLTTKITDSERGCAIISNVNPMLRLLTAS